MQMHAVQPRIEALATSFYFHRHYSVNQSVCQGFVQYFNLLLTFAGQICYINGQNIDNAARVERFLVYIRLAGSANQ
jgi:ABC-type antimicrobial peptide transport system permease subunit